ncbi:LysR family transcriptional regulator [Phenylobacterium sp.]|uniref:LysR family transcriptional regulator n=1 Tax=Phenylobacterium sp. TaxID=1871053 RepID=UPI0035B4DA00
MDRLEAMAAFVAVVESGGFTAAARRVDTPVSSISRKVAALEAQLSTRLLNRNTRGLSLTAAGGAYLEHCRRVLAEVAEAEAALRRDSGEVAGVLRVTAPAILGRMAVSGLAGRLLAEHPLLEVELSLSDRFVDLVAEGFDVAVRTGELEPSSLIARKLGEFRRILCCSPGFLAANGPIDSAAEIDPRQCLVFTRIASQGRWRLQDADGGEVVIDAAGRLRGDNADSLYGAALAGAGIILAPEWQVRDDLAAGRLVHLASRLASAPTPIHAVFANAKLLSPPVRVFVDAAAAWFAREGGAPSRR